MRKRGRWCMWMMRRSEPNGRSAGRAGWRISGNRFWRFWQREPDLASLEILRRAREAGYEGGKTALYALVASLRPKSSSLAKGQYLSGKIRLPPPRLPYSAPRTPEFGRPARPRTEAMRGEGSAKSARCGEFVWTLVARIRATQNLEFWPGALLGSMTPNAVRIGLIRNRLDVVHFNAFCV